jgi:serine protease Do
MKRISSLFVALVVLVLTGCSAIPQVAKPAAAPGVEAAPASYSPPQTAPLEPISAEDALAALEGRLETIYEQVSPSVVNIQVVDEIEAGEEGTPVFPQIPDWPFQFPFDLPTPEEPQTQSALGSGFVWDTEGHIVTNNHVVEGADKITVTFSDGTSTRGTLVGADHDSDLAVVKVDLPADQLHPVQLADSMQVKVGQLAVAIGNPFGLEGTMTVGFVSALGRLLPVERGTSGTGYSIPDIIQTDAPINPGNSGGVLVDDQGQVIGVTAAIESPVRANAGIGFAIPAAIVEKVVPLLITTGHYQHPWLGISGTALNLELSEAMDLDSDQHGALVVEVIPGSPADEAGLRGSDREVDIEGQPVRVGGDVIVAIEGEPVQGVDDIISYLARYTQIGDKITLSILRQGKEQTVEVELAARPSEDEGTAAAPREIAGQAWLGVQGLTLVPEVAEAMGLDADQEGVLIEQVIKGSPADEAQLRGSYKTMTIDGEQVLIGGDVIVALDDHSVRSVDDLAALIAQSEPGDEIRLALLRDGRRVQVRLTLTERPADAD